MPRAVDLTSPVPIARSTVRARERAELAAITALAVLGGAAAAVAAPAMTATTTADAVWAAAFGAALTMASSQARRSAWVLSSALVVAAAGLGPELVLAGAALGLSVGSVALDRRHPVVGAVIGGLLAAAVVRLPAGPVRGLPAIVALVAAGWVAGSAIRLARPRTRRVVRDVSVGLGLVGLVAVLGLAWVGGRAMRSFDSASAELRVVMRASSVDDRTLGDHLLAIDEDLGAARAAMEGPIVSLADHLPLLGRQSRAVRLATDVGIDIGATSAAVAGAVDLRRIDFEDQRIDVEALADVQGPLADVQVALRRADEALSALDRSWLVDPVDRRLRDLHEEIVSAAPSTALAADVVGIAPGMLGAEGSRRYLLLFMQPSEARGLGGFIGNWAEVTAVDGRIELVETGRAEDISRAPGADDRVLRGPADYVDRYGPQRVERFFQDITFSPDMPSVGQVAADQYEQTTGRAVDSVVVIDPIALASLLEVTGPVQLRDLSVPLDHTNAADYLLSGQYLEVDDREERVDALEQASRRTFDRLLHRRLLEPSRMGRILGPAVDEGRLMAWSRRADEQAVFEQLGLDGALWVPDGGELLSVVTQNSGNNKIDYYLHRAVDYELGWDPATGSLAGTVRVTLRNEAPARGLPPAVIGNRDDLTVPDGDNAQILTVYTALVGTALRVDGAAVPVNVGLERGARAYSADLVIPAGGTRVVELDVEGSVTPGPQLVLRWDAQPLVHPDELTTTVTVPAPWSLATSTWRRADASDATTTFIADTREVG